MAEHYLAPPGECYPPRAAAGGGAGQPRRRAPRPAAGDADAIPCCDALRGGPLPFSALARRLGRDPDRAPRAAAARRPRRQSTRTSPRRGFRQVRIAVLVDRRGGAASRGQGQAEVLERLRAAGGRAPVADLVRDRPSLRGALDRLVEQGAIAIEEERAVRDPRRCWTGGTALRPDPTARPGSARSSRSSPRRRRGPFAPFLLHGVTGSGKTEVYFRAVERSARPGPEARSSSSPEIALTPVPRARGGRRASARRWPCCTASCRRASGTTSGGASARARRRVAIGARSAVFAPVDDLGLIIVDEEHEAAYKQDESPRYHARDVAVMRATLEGARWSCGSATPSLESLRQRAQGQVPAAGPAHAHRRARGWPASRWWTAGEVLKAGGDPILTPPLREALAERLERKRAVAAAPEPPRLRHEPPLPRVRAAGLVPQLLGRC